MLSSPSSTVLLAAAVAAAAAAPLSDSVTEPIDLPDNTPAGTWLADLRRILGLDSASAGTLTILNPSHAVVRSLAINTTAGYLYATRDIDRDDLCRGDLAAGRACCRPEASDAPCEVQLQLSYAATTSASRGRAIAALRLRLADINDNAPAFRHSSTTLRVHEGPMSSGGPPAAISGAGVALQAWDPDQGANGAIVYRLEPAVDSQESVVLPFRLDQTDRHRLALLVTADLDRERLAQYKLRLLAIDGGRPALTGTLSVTVDVMDVNDEPPVFEQSEYSARLREDAHVGQIVARVRARDRDAGVNSEVHYSLSSAGPQASAATHFSIVRSAEGEGIVTLRSPLDAESLSRIVVYIVAQDRGNPPKSAEAKLTVTVDDVNDEKPRIEIVYLSSDPTAPTLSRGLLVENADSEDVAKAEVTDPDSGPGGHVTCTTDHDGFALIPMRLPDAPLAVRSSGAASMSAANRREFLVRSQRAFDREQGKGTLQFNVVCSDEGRPTRLTSSAVVRLRLLDVNDNAPAFTRKHGYDFQLPENEPATQGGRFLVGAVAALDLDEGVNAKVIYGIEQDPTGAFQINSATRELFAVQPLDREKLLTTGRSAQVQLRVSATDSNLDHHRAFADVRIQVLDRNDCPPRFMVAADKGAGMGADYEFRVEESSGSGSGGSSATIGTVRAEDDDEPGPFEYAMDTAGVDPETASTFRVDRHSGQVRAIRPLDRETRAVYVFPVTARDTPRPGSGDKRLTSTATVTVHVLDVNDCAPEFTEPPASGKAYSIADNARAGNQVTRIAAKDADLGDNSRVTYAIVRGPAGSATRDLFELDREDGLLYVARALMPGDARPEPYELTIEAADRGKPSPLRTRTVVRVFVASADAISATSGGAGNSPAEAAGERRGGKGGPNRGGDSLAQQRTRTTIVLGLIVFFFLLLIIVAFVVLILLRPCRRADAGSSRRGAPVEGADTLNEVDDVHLGGGIRDFKTIRGYLVAGNGKSGDFSTMARGSIDATSPPELYNMLTTAGHHAAFANQPTDSTPMTVVCSMPAHPSDYQSLRPAPVGTARRKKPPLQQQQQQQQHQQQAAADAQSPVYYQAGCPVVPGVFERANSASLRTTVVSSSTMSHQLPAAQHAKSQPATPMDRRKFSAFNPYADASFV